VVGAVVENLDPEQALFELTLGVDSVLFGLPWDDLHALVQDSVGKYHPFVDVFWRLNQFLQFDLLLPLLIIH